MKKVTPERVQFAESVEHLPGVRVGKIVGVESDGSIFVDFPGNRGVPVPARFTTSAKVKIPANTDVVGREILLVFENDDPRRPIVLDTLYSFIDEISGSSPAQVEEEKKNEILIDGESMVFDAKKEIVLRCGKASITLTRAGKVIIRGEYISNHASGLNRIKGGSVQIN